MTPAEVLNTMIALKLHFSTVDYDYIKYQGKLKRPLDYSKRKDKLQLQKIARQKDPFGLMLANISENANIWSGDIVSEEGFRIYQEWQKRKEAQLYWFTEDIKKLEYPLISNFEVENHQHPLALRLYIGEKISLETLCILDKMFNYYGHWGAKLKDDLVWKMMWSKIPKYGKFVQFDNNPTGKLRTSIREVFHEKAKECLHLKKMK
jgi:hypothetical protein